MKREREKKKNYKHRKRTLLSFSFQKTTTCCCWTLIDLDQLKQLLTTKLKSQQSAEPCSTWRWLKIQPIRFCLQSSSTHFRRQGRTVNAINSFFAFVQWHFPLFFSDPFCMLQVTLNHLFSQHTDSLRNKSSESHYEWVIESFTKPIFSKQLIRSGSCSLTPITF